MSVWCCWHRAVLGESCTCFRNIQGPRRLAAYAQHEQLGSMLTAASDSWHANVCPCRAHGTSTPPPGTLPCPCAHVMFLCANRRVRTGTIKPRTADGLCLTVSPLQAGFTPVGVGAWCYFCFTLQFHLQYLARHLTSHSTCKD
jgi:hypothetical protein